MKFREKNPFEKKKISIPVSVIDSYMRGSLRLRDSIKILRTNIQFAGIDDEIKSIVVTSTNKGEGKTTTSCNLAIAMAEAGKRTLLVEADCRHPMLGNRLKIRPKLGFVSHLYGKTSLDDIITATELPGLFLLDAEPHISNPVEIIDSNKFTVMMAELRDKFDMVIYDTAPLGSFIEAALIAARADATIIIIAPGMTDIEKVKGVLEQLKKANARVLGAVLNGIEVERTNYHYDYYYYGNRDKKKGAKT
ncbi:MAG: CpsD/CapB family tyrosine-protein kinase [Clostridia bacterium]